MSIKNRPPLDVDAVIQGVGVSPATSYLEDSLLEKDGSIIVDENFQVKGVSNTYAVGDIATYPYKSPGSDSSALVRIEHWNVAQQSGRSAARKFNVHRTPQWLSETNCGVAVHIATGKTPESFTPIFWSALGLQLRYCGNTSLGYDDVVIQGSLEENKFIA